MQTASLRQYEGPGRIVVARYAPREMRGGYRCFKALAPGKRFKTVTQEEYVRLYREQLEALDAQQVWDDLHAMAAELPHGNASATPVLLCYEKPPFTGRSLCHRRLIAQWFEKELGPDFRVQELGYDGSDGWSLYGETLQVGLGLQVPK